MGIVQNCSLPLCLSVCLSLSLSFMEKHNLFHTFQSGFRSKYSCHTALSAMCDMWLSAVDRSEIVGAVFLDFRKAFDLVDHTILQQKFKSIFE